MSAYTVVQKIGQGGFGFVEEVINDGGEHVARKTFHPANHIPQIDHKKLMERFKREVKIQTNIGGHEVMSVLDSDLNASVPWFVMPLADTTYDAQIAEDKRSGSVDIDAVSDILNSLEYLHDLDYVHRDLNPKNILHRLFLSIYMVY